MKQCGKIEFWELNPYVSQKLPVLYIWQRIKTGNQKKTSSNSMPFIPDFHENRSLSACSTAVWHWNHLGLYFQLWLGHLLQMLLGLSLFLSHQ